MPAPSPPGRKSSIVYLPLADIAGFYRRAVGRRSSDGLGAHGFRVAMQLIY